MRLIESSLTLVVTYGVLVLLEFITLFPIALLVLNSVKGAAEIVQSPLSLPATLRWNGCSEVVLRAPPVGRDDHCQAGGLGFRISQDRGEGIILHGTRQWTDYRVEANLTQHLGAYGGIAVRAQGLRRHYAARILRLGRLQIVRVRDEAETVLAEAPLTVELERAVAMVVTTNDPTITATADGVTISIADDALGLLVHEGSQSTQAVRVGPMGGAA